MTRTVTLVLLIGVLALTPETAGGEDASTGVRSEGPGWVLLSAGGDHTCGIRASGRLYCWGADGHGQLGDGAGSGDHSAPVQVVGGWTDWTAVNLGPIHTCGLRSNGRLFCWGFNGAGRLGNGGRNEDRARPVEVSGGATDWRSISAGESHTCATKRNGRLYCWGKDRFGQLGNGGANAAGLVPVEVAGNATNWASVSSTGGHTCAVRTTGRLFCWGRDDHGQLGDGGPATDRTIPGRVGRATDWTAVSTGWEHTCGRRSSGRLYCWGADSFGQVGNGLPDQSDQHRPLEVVGGATTWSAPSAGFRQTCARQQGGRLFCWGSDEDGELGDGTPNNTETAPVEVLGGFTTWAAVDTGGRHTCGRRGPASFCWGDDDQGQLGDGLPLTDHASPVVVG